MYLSNLIPPYQDNNFSSEAKSSFMTELEKVSYKTKIFQGVIDLQVCSTVWLNDVVEEVILSDNTIIPGIQLRRHADQLQLVDFDKCQINGLRKLCQTADIFVPTTQSLPKPIRKKKAEVIPQWAFFDCDQPNEVIFASAVSPNEFFVRLTKYNDL